MIESPLGRCTPVPDGACQPDWLHDLLQLAAFFMRLAPDAAIGVCVGPLREIVGLSTPLVVCSQQIKDCTEHVKLVNFTRTVALAGALWMPLDPYTLFGADATWILCSYGSSCLTLFQQAKDVAQALRNPALVQHNQAAMLAHK